MHSWLELSRSAFEQNFSIFEQILGPVPLMPVLKSNAYGHGLKEILEILLPLKPKWIAVNYLEEAEIARKGGFTGKILLVGPIFKDQFKVAHDLSVSIFMSHRENLSAWLQTEHKPMLHLKIDSGMSRQGFFLDQLPEVLSALSPFNKYVEGIATHFANVEDVLDHAYADSQMLEFERARTLMRQAGFAEFLSHAASSASTLILKASRYDLCRVGISIYGFWPSQPTRLSYHQLNLNIPELKPVLSWKTRVAQVKEVPAGRYIGYGITFRALKNMTIAVLPVGYFEGFPRIAGASHSYVLIAGHRCPIVGRVCMNMMMVDVGHLSSIEVGQVVTMIGEDHGEIIAASDISGWSQTIHYEFVSRIHADIPRRIVS